MNSVSTLRNPLPPTEIRFQVEFWSGDHPHDLNRLLTHLELGQVECDINTFIYPVMWPAARGFDPPINDLSLHWVPWDEELSTEKVIHFYVADISLYNELATLAHHLNGLIGIWCLIKLHEFIGTIHCSWCIRFPLSS